MAINLSQLPKLTEVIQRLGKNDRERASALGITERSLQNWKKKQISRNLLSLTPEALRALADDLEQQAA